VPAVEPSISPLEIVRTRLHESQQLAVYEAIERLVRAGEAVGLDANSMVRMLDKGMSLEQLLGVIESQMECSQITMQSPAEDRRAA
jgi:hypothetical protein